mgnify:CR=1 FL=1
MRSPPYNHGYPGSFYYAGYLPDERTPAQAKQDAEFDYPAIDATCEVCDLGFFYSPGRADAVVCDDCWDEEIDAAQGGDK